MMNELHDKYTFVNNSNLNLNASDLNSCVMLGFVLICCLFYLSLSLCLRKMQEGRTFMSCNVLSIP